MTRPVPAPVLLSPIDLGDGLVLRALTLEDARALFRRFQTHRDYLAAFEPRFRDNRTKSLREVKADIRLTIANVLIGGNISCGIFLKGVLIGEVGAEFIPQRGKHLMMSMWIVPAHRGKGIVVRATTALIKFAFENNLASVAWMTIDPQNEASLRVAAKLGFKVSKGRRVVYRLHMRPEDVLLTLHAPKMPVL